MKSSFQVRILILSREVGSFKFEWTRRKVASDNYYRQICKQTIVKFSLAYSFWKTFFIGQILKHVDMTYSFLELLILLILINSSKCLYFGAYFSLHHRSTVCKYKLQSKSIIDTNRYKFSLASDIDVEKSYFFHG